MIGVCSFKGMRVATMVITMNVNLQEIILAKSHMLNLFMRKVAIDFIKKYNSKKIFLKKDIKFSKI